MSDVTVSATEPTIAVDSSTQKPLAPAQAPAPAPAAEGKPLWLDARLEQKQREVLKELGVESLSEAKKALDKIRAVEDEKKSDAQKRGELESSLKAERAEKEAMASALGAYAKGQMAALNEAQRSAVEAVAGDDPAKQLKTIEALRPTWASAAAPAAPAAVQDTAPAPAAPKDGSPTAPPTPKEIWAGLKESNPVLAARYAIANGVFDQ